MKIKIKVEMKMKTKVKIDEKTTFITTRIFFVKDSYWIVFSDAIFHFRFLAFTSLYRTKQPHDWHNKT